MRSLLFFSGVFLLAVSLRAGPAAPPLSTTAVPGYSFTLPLSTNAQLPMIWVPALRGWVGRYETSNLQYRQYDAAFAPVFATNYSRRFDVSNEPVVCVTWDDAKNYCSWLNRSFRSRIPDGYEFRLPAESEWTTFARCGDSRVYPWGNTWPPPNDLNYKGEEGGGLIYNLFHDEIFIKGHTDRHATVAPVEDSGRNEWGLYGVGGNVWEWCEDWFDASKSARVIRGGAWNNQVQELLKVDHRTDCPPDRKNEVIGFRVVLLKPLP